MNKKIAISAAAAFTCSLLLTFPTSAANVRIPSADRTVTYTHHSNTNTTCETQIYSHHYQQNMKSYHHQPFSCHNKHGHSF